MFKSGISITNFRALFLALFWTTTTLVLLPSCANLNPEKNWNETVKRVSSGVVSIQVDVPIAFDGKWNSSTYATGFIVDAKQGIILTNRHVVSPGPVTAKAILINNEEIDLTPLYIDPVHDFGFFKYQPSQIKHLKPHEFTLSDKKPTVGQEIRIIGNDAGQKISILDGTISRLDRSAPNYGKGAYNDFNIFYIQAATASTGGSSGSPVINLRGEAVALNAGSQTKSANAFYLPLEKIKLALNKLQKNEKIARGTIQTTFNSTPYAELERLGLSEELASQYRQQFPQLKGLLVARAIIPQSGAANSLAIGDILLSINEQTIAEFSHLESQLNNHVNQNINISVLRRGQQLSLSVKVDDLETLSPTAYLKFNGSTFHNLSYQQARHFNKPISGVYVSSSTSDFSQAGVPSRSVITEFNGIKINTVADLHQQLSQIPSGKKVHLRYFDFRTPNTTNYALVEINRTWFEHSYCQRNVELGYWPCEKQKDTLQAEKSPQLNAQAAVVNNELANTLVNVKFTSPYSIQGRNGNNSRSGTGVIVDVKKGWVVVERNVVFSMLGDVKLIFNNRLEVTGKVEYIHPLHNLALVSYQPEQLSNVAVAQITISKTPMQNGQPILQMGLNYDGAIEYRETLVDTHDELWLQQFNVPQFIEKNIKVTYLVNPNPVIDGILVNAKNEVTALWATFEQSDNSGKEITSLAAGLSIDYVAELIELVNAKKPVYSFDIDMTLLAPVDALQMGLTDEWITKLQAHNPSTDKIIAIYNVAANSPSAAVFKRGDILLTVNDTPVSSFRDVEKLAQQPEVNVTYFSEGKVQTATLKTTPLYGNDIEQVFFWSGLYLHSPHRAAQLQGNVSAEGVYVASYSYGSPATRYGMYAMQRIVEIDGQAITTTADFVNAVKGKAHQESVLIKTLDFSNNARVITLRVDNHYWPFYQLQHSDGAWQKIDLL